LPKILFWTEGGLGFVSFEKVLCIQGIAHDAANEAAKNAI
jgi:hypothetical protein